MDIIYVLVSDESDTYLEQTVLSIKSLKKYMTDSNVILLVDSVTYGTFIGNRKKIVNIADRVISVHLPDMYNKKNKSRFLKTTMYQYTENDFVYIDGDTLICGDISYRPQDYDIAAVLDLHLKISECPLRERLEENARKCNYRPGYRDKHFNGGFLAVKHCDKSKEFFEMWHALWKQALKCGITQDQTSLNEADCRMGGIIGELPGFFNCQIQRYGTGLQFLSDARMIHYFASNAPFSVPYDLSDDDLLRHALDDDYPDELNNILDNPKSAFRKVKYVISDPVLSVLIESNAFILLRRVYENHSSVYKAFNGFISFVVKLSHLGRKKQ